MYLVYGSASRRYRVRIGPGVGPRVGGRVGGEVDGRAPLVVLGLKALGRLADPDHDGSAGIEGRGVHEVSVRRHHALPYGRN
jgi:hypothetical protein